MPPLPGLLTVAAVLFAFGVGVGAIFGVVVYWLLS